MEYTQEQIYQSSAFPKRTTNDSTIREIKDELTAEKYEHAELVFGVVTGLQESGRCFAQKCTTKIDYVARQKQDEL